MERRGIETDRGSRNRLARAANQAREAARQVLDQARAKAHQAMDRGARIMAELAQLDTAKLDDALRRRKQAKQQTKEATLERPKQRRRGRDFGL